MGLPFARNTNYVGGTTPEIDGGDLNAMQDSVIGEFLGNPQWGDNSDGSEMPPGSLTIDGTVIEGGIADFDGVNTFLFATLAGGVYTLTRSVCLDLVTGTHEIAGPFDFACRFLQPKAGFKITANGKNGVGTTGGAGAPAGQLAGGGAGGAGGVGFFGSNGTGTSNALGGSGGNSGYTLSPQTGGTATPLTASQGDPRDPLMPPGHVIGGGAVVAIAGGGGGGGGSGNGNDGGAGGGGGGERTLRAAVIDLTSADLFFIQAHGGNAGAPTGSGFGGGGGGGGHVLLRFGVLINPTGHPITDFVDVNFGTHTVGAEAHPGFDGVFGSANVQQIYAE